MSNIRNELLLELREKAVKAGANAIVGLRYIITENLISNPNQPIINMAIKYTVFIFLPFSIFIC